MPSLTRHEEGSFKELWAISLPMMLSAFSLLMLVFVDRLMLARYSTEAMNAAVNASTLGWAFICGTMVLSSISEVFVAQNNGAGFKEKLGAPVWQMIWFSFMTLALFIPLALFGGDLIYGSGSERQMEKDYFRWMMFFGSSFPFYTALAGFFVGQGKTMLITLLTLATNLVNAGLDVLFIFGIEGVFPAMGVKGAAIATSSSSIFQAVVLFWFFTNRKNRVECGTGNYALVVPLFRECLRVGIPGALFVVFEVLGFAAYYGIMTIAGDNYITIAGICQSFVILFYFAGEGVGKAATAIAGNYIGAKRYAAIPQVLRMGAKLHLLFFAVIIGVLFFFNDALIGLFLAKAPPEQIEFLRGSLHTSLYCISIYLLFEGLRMLLTGVLTAAGDTFFLMIAGSLSVWLFLVLPIYYFIIIAGFQAEVSSLICALYSGAACLLYLFRFRGGRWQEISLLQRT